MFSELLSQYRCGEIDYPDVVKAMSGLDTISVKNSGVVYTPIDIANYMANLLAPKIHDTIMEPSVGHGIFLFSLLEYSKGWALDGAEILNWFTTRVSARDINPDTVDQTRQLMSAYFERQYGIEAAPELFNNIECRR